MSARGVIVAAALLLFAGVAAGAFGAHALRATLAPERLAVFQTGVQYHLIHALGALLVGVLWLHTPDAPRTFAISAALLIAGIVLFSGSLYVLALSGSRGFGWITPIGGLAWLIGWLALATGAWRMHV